MLGTFQVFAAGLGILKEASVKSGTPLPLAVNYVTMSSMQERDFSKTLIQASGSHRTGLQSTSLT